MKQRGLFEDKVLRITWFMFFSLAEATKILYSFAILMSWLLQFYVPIQLLTPWLRRMRHYRWKEAALRIGLTLFTCTL